MNKNSTLCNFIAQNTNWEELLSSPPFDIKIKHGTGENADLCIFNYNHRTSDFSIPEVQEARGIIINVKAQDVVCWPFRKFGNYGEYYADSIDWQSARVTEKMDGSIIKVWFNKNQNKWVVSTNGQILAEDAQCECKNIDSTNEIPTNFREIFDRVINPINYEYLEKDNTYIFELCSPYNRVVVNYEEPQLYHIGTRNNISGREMEIFIGIQQPREYQLKSLEDVISAAGAIAPQNQSVTDCKDEDVSFEGFVVRDKDYHRIKVKSWKYIAKHYLSGPMAKADLLEIALSGDGEEFSLYMPAQAAIIESYQKKIAVIKEKIHSICVLANNTLKECSSDKDFALKWQALNIGELSYIGYMIKAGKTEEEIYIGFTSSKWIKMIER